MSKSKKACRHTILVQNPGLQSKARCQKCHKLFEEDQLFPLIEGGPQGLYETLILYRRRSKTTDEDIAEALGQD